jgi:hypothetical protein
MMLKIFDVVPGWVYAAAVASLLVATGVGRYQLGAERLAHQTTLTKHAEQRAQAEANARKIEQELQDAQARNEAETARLQTERDRARADAGRAADRLRNAATAIASTCKGSSAADVGTPAGDSIAVLADVLGRADKRAGELADIADARYIAGRACERAYDALITKP